MEAYFTALILMGGEGRRLGSSLPKQFHTLGSLKVYQHTLEVFRQSNLFQEIILVCHPDWIEGVQKETSLYPEVKVVEGGETRQSSSYKGLLACHPACQYVMIHDSVRPLVSLEILQNNIEVVLKTGAVDTCIPSTDTVIITHDEKTIDSIPPRSLFKRGQTPQTFSYPLIRKAHETTTRSNATDDCQLLIDLNYPVAIVEGSEVNIKITSERDLELAHFLLDIKLFN